MEVVKRDGRIVPFDDSRIYRAIDRCFAGLGYDAKVGPQELTRRAVLVVSGKYERPTVEQIQDVVESVLLAADEIEAARAYIRYRYEHEKSRRARDVPSGVREAFAESDAYFATPIQKFQFYDKYSRFDYFLGRRETWVETVDRAVAFLRKLSENKLPEKDYARIRDGILNMKVMPSMRLLAMAGPAAERSGLTIYNCAYLPVDSISSFYEATILAMSGCGVGYSVERQYVEQLPRVQRQGDGTTFTTFVIPDTAEGWANAIQYGLETWFNGWDVRFDYSEIRPAGAPLMTKGGRSSGPAPLRKLLTFARDKVLSRQGGFLRPIDAHDIMCAIGGSVISGGMRRTALLSLFDFDDAEMKHCKDGDFWRDNSQRWNANNSAVWPDRPLTQSEVAHHLLEMFDSGRGEPGIFNRRAALNTIPERRNKEYVYGTNPCGEVLLRPKMLCNLSSIIARSNDNLVTLLEKAELATIIGTIQSMATNFPGMPDEWRKNCEEERLLGVDLNGQLDSPVAMLPDVQALLKQQVLRINGRYAKLLGINRAAATTCVKPSGNSSLLLDCSSGLHARWSKYYVRNIRISALSPLLGVMRDAGVPMSPENGQDPDSCNTWVIHFPVKSPDRAMTRNDRTAIQQCNYWLQNKIQWTEQNPSVTISYKPDEILDIIKWVWQNQDNINGMTFLPTFDALYDQMPYEEITEAEYNELAAVFPEIDFSKVWRYEDKDLTSAAQELACMAGSCELA